MPDLFTTTTWGSRLLRRAAGSVGAAVVIAGVVPALANAAGANLPNPVGIALRASGDVLTGGEDEQDCVEVKPGAQVLLPNGGKPSSTSVCPDEETDETDAADETETSPSPSPSPTESEATDEEEAEESGDENHGQIVSTVAKCTPRGKDPLLEVDGAPSNHGGYVRVAAHGETLTTPWGTFDLSTMAGAEALCAALEQARADLPESETEKAKKDKAKKAKKNKKARQGS